MERRRRDALSVSPFRPFTPRAHCNLSISCHKMRPVFFFGSSKKKKQSFRGHEPSVNGDGDMRTLASEGLCGTERTACLANGGRRAAGWVVSPVQPAR